MANSYMISLFFLLTCVTFTYSVPLNPVPAVFIFGDSSADVGTNSYISNSQVKANFPYHGADFDNLEATGRFSNKFVTVDYLCKSMGLEKSPEPFLSYNDEVILPSETFSGVNFASAGSGLLNTTGAQKFIVPMRMQLEQFAKVQMDFRGVMSHAEAREFFARSIYIISVGTDDMEHSHDQHLIISQPNFLGAVSIAYLDAIKVLYGLGARKFGLISALPVGCTPKIRANSPRGDCSKYLNDLSTNFHIYLDTFAATVSADLEDFKYSIGNTYEIMMKVINNNPPFEKFVVDTACCGSGRLNAEEPCSVTANLCDNREKYAFWDGLHLTDAASEVAARELYNGGSEVVSPINFRQLVAEPVRISFE